MTTTTFNIEEVAKIYALQHDFSVLQHLKNTTARERVAKIKSIEAYLLNAENQAALCKALWQDLRKSAEETVSTEIVPVVTSMQYIYKNIGAWMQDKPVGAPLAMTGMSSYIKYEPKGNILIIAPWNYPFQLVLNPLIHAIAAGNTVIIKPSEMAAATAAFIQKMVEELFLKSEVAVIQGDIPITTALLELPFNHIFFTGSPAVGKIVMRAAANHLTSVTLELGGKSPVIIDNSVNIMKVTERVVWAKLINNGQTCIAPDYLFIHKNQKHSFVKYFKATVEKFYNPKGEGIQQSPDYTRIINSRNFHRLKNLVEDAVLKGADVVCGGEMDEKDLFIAPILLENVTDEMQILHEEIFGPILPIMVFSEIAEIIPFINARPKPLALYIMSDDTKNTDFLLNNTTAGGTAINELLVTTINPYLPFGGVNNSGIGKSNGLHSFIEFSNERGIVRRKWLDLKLIYPPYNKKIFSYLLTASKL